MKIHSTQIDEDMENDIIKADRISNQLTAYLKSELNNPGLEISSALTQLQGGYETSIYSFQLDGAGEEWPKELVLRLYPPSYGAQQAVRESTVQNLLAREGFPVARAHLVCRDLSILGGAFMIMDFLPGQLLMFAFSEEAPELLGKTHAKLHKIDPRPLIKRMQEMGLEEEQFRLNSRYQWLKDRAVDFPWIRETLAWLLDNRPAEPEQLSVCHGDFHPLNILVHNNKISGVLDWPGFVITDSVFDVANTIVLTTIPARYLTASMEGFAAVDWDWVVESYLTSYQTYKQLDQTNLEYYRVRRCLMALVQGAEGQPVWQQPLIVKDLIDFIDKTTGNKTRVPA